MIKIEGAKDKIIDAVYEAGQGHIFRFWDELTSEQQARFLGQLESINLESLKRLINDYVLYPQEKVSSYELRPAPFIMIPKTGEEFKRQKEARDLGEEALRKGKIACLLVAGGQNTRMGYDGPKGTFPIGPITQKSLFALHAEKILALRRRYEISLPWYIMTSPFTDEATRRYFEQHNFFGLPKDGIRFFIQGMFPSADFAGKLLMDAKDHIVMSPNGHGGTIKALKDSGALHQMEEEGIEEIFYFQVDNPLIKIADPVFIGYHLKEGADKQWTRRCFATVP